MTHPFTIQSSGNIKLKELYSNSDIYLYPYARYAFLEALKMLDIKTIYLPTFICRDMLAPINVLRIKYFLYEVNEKLEPILEDIKCDAILMVNYFGFSQNIKPFENYKKKYNSLIIEDNAHGFLSKDRNGVLLGTRGDIGLLSIRKTVFLPNGGALLINNEFLKDKKYQSAETQQSYEDVKHNKKFDLKNKIFSKYLGISIILLRRVIRFIKTGSSIPLPDPLSEKYMPLNSYLTPILKNGMISIDIEKEIQRRREMYIKIKDYAKKFNIIPIYDLNENAVPFEFAFIDNGNYKKFERYLYAKGFFILPWPDLSNSIIDTCPKFYNNVKVVPFLW
ncbi:DegT/DnrJ/EryC1/StrS family aminotransferase [Aliarcobacter butzleri]|uniref:DegT/DnrJ/EryC1/StrS family aminotransferase n=1 Tax=Aliarcobacter butzleri TaxID=28197 RepID=UPI001EDC743E|nr:DegT/DnrJ/EryC1/StrS family aminotransferase [Aliarcobacter butzleri]MCG3658923.1 DegT/DnrJ/EryC1/StrS family aminotransferase [Aliarcobacter butzleri]MCG3701761.1 DegT/DnrJ/EryC1/StrS family aminotransferase [Aliarcobacter butzleri]MCG3703954.1 DegT/DnrJ/EryC1/StrS family aminotransferase [Aliarcobacter butzleri]